VADSDLNLHK